MPNLLRQAQDILGAPLRALELARIRRKRRKKKGGFVKKVSAAVSTKGQALKAINEELDRQSQR